MKQFIVSACVATVLGACQSTGSEQTGSRSFSALAGSTIRVDHFRHINPDCSNIGLARVAATTPPRGGRVEFKPEGGFPTFPADNPRAHCSSRRVPGVAVYYRPDRNFSGADNFSVDIYWVDGVLWSRDYTVQVTR